MLREQANRPCWREALLVRRLLQNPIAGFESEHAPFSPSDTDVHEARAGAANRNQVWPVSLPQPFYVVNRQCMYIVRACLVQTCVRAVITRPATQRVNTQTNHCHNSHSGVVKPHTNVRPLGIINKRRIMAAELSQLLRLATSKHLKAERDLPSKELHTKMISSLLNHGVHHLQ